MRPNAFASKMQKRNFPEVVKTAPSIYFAQRGLKLSKPGVDCPGGAFVNGMPLLIAQGTKPPGKLSVGMSTPHFFNASEMRVEQLSLREFEGKWTYPEKVEGHSAF